ncbi:MAG TPA: S53 family peptidase [Ktedonobacterales bacterium]|nr:S53 family peptidase [Ktedonobacterales bacterium]
MLLIAALTMFAMTLTTLAACAPTAGQTRARASSPSGAAQAASACAPAPTSSASASAKSPKTPERLGPTDTTRTLTISLVLKGRAGADAAIAALNDPHSPDYHHFLSPEEYARRFGADSATVASVVAALRANGLHVPSATASAGLLVAQGTVATLESLFGVRLSDYCDSHGQRYIAPDATPHIPASLAGVAGVLGLDTRSVMRTGSLLNRQRPQVGGVAGYGPTELRSAYDLNPLYQAGLDGAGQTVALPEIDQFRKSDTQSYDQTFGLHTGAITVTEVAGGASSFSPEPVLDIEVIHAIAPAANIDVYETQSDLGSVAQMLSQIVSDNHAQVISISLGACEAGLDPSQSRSFYDSIDNTFRQAAAQGMTVLVASGDSGAYGCQDNTLSIQEPSSNPFVTAVGGTALFLNSDGSYNHEAGWEGPLEASGGGGGLSVVYQRPSWQTGPGVNNQFSNGARQAPDVAGDADPLTGYSVYYSGDHGCSGSDCWQVVGGTSGAAPLWAGIVLLANQLARSHGGKPMGQLNPRLYQLGASAQASQVFHDVTVGGNLYYPATSGWDYSTGLGTPIGAPLVQALAG